MSIEDGGGPARHELIAEVARAYYLDDLTKVQIGQSMGMSRFKVARLLDVARDTGIVTITINENPQPEDTAAARLKQRLNLADCLVIPSGDGLQSRRLVAAAAARYLSLRIAPHDVLGMSWGRTLAAMTEFLGALPPTTVVQMTGSIGENMSISPFEILRRVTQQSGGTALPIIAPLIADTPEAAETMRTQTQTRRAFDAFDKLTVAVVSVGSWRPATSQMIDYLTEGSREALTGNGVVGEVAGIFISKSGEILHFPQQDQLVGITAEQLRHVPRKIVAADGPAKAATVIGAVRAGLINTLVVDSSLATEILRLLVVEE